MMKRFFSIALFSLLLIFIMYALLVPFSKISVVELKTDKKLKTARSYRIKEKEVLSYLKNYEGQLLWKVSLKELVKTVGTFYTGAEVYVIRKFPNRLIVFLEKKDIALLLLKEGEFFYSVSYEGEIGVKKGSGESLDFPVLRGSVFWNDLLLRKRALSIFSSIPKNNWTFSTQNISEITYNKKNDSLFFYLIPGHFILELRKQLSPKQVQNIDFVLNYLNQRGKQGRVIDARLDKKIIVKNLN